MGMPTLEQIFVVVVPGLIDSYSHTGETDLMLSVNATPSVHICGVLFKAYSNLAKWSNASYFFKSQT